MNTLPLVLLNTTIVTSEGLFEVKKITLSEAQQLISENAENFISAIGHPATAEMMNTLLNRSDIYDNRYNFYQEVGQTALCFKIPRQPEGKILSLEELKELPYEFKTITRIK